MMIHRVGSHINRSRNQIVSYFLSSNCTHLIFLDSDISGFEYFIKKIVELEKRQELPPLVGGIYPIKEYNWKSIEDIQQITIKNKKLTEEQQKLYAMEFNINLEKKNINEILEFSGKFHGLYPVKHIPGGCMCISRSVFQKMMSSFPNRKYQQGANEAVVKLEHSSGEFLYNFFDSFIHDYGNNVQYLSEDYGFCELWSRLGGVIYADMETVLGHFDGGLEYRGSYLQKLKLKVAVFMEVNARKDSAQKQQAQQLAQQQAQLAQQQQAQQQRMLQSLGISNAKISTHPPLPPNQQIPSLKLPQIPEKEVI